MLSVSSEGTFGLDIGTMVCVSKMVEGQKSESDVVDIDHVPATRIFNRRDRVFQVPLRPLQYT